MYSAPVFFSLRPMLSNVDRRKAAKQPQHGERRMQSGLRTPRGDRGYLILMYIFCSYGILVLMCFF